MRVIWRSGPRGASWLEIDTQLARLAESQHPDLQIDVAAGGGRDNLAALKAGACQLATSIDFLGAAAYTGQEPFGGDAFPRLRTLYSGWPIIPFHLIHEPDPAADMSALLTSPGLRIGIPPTSTSDELTFRRVLAFYGASYQTIGAAGGTVLHRDYTDLVESFASGKIDYLFGATAAPATVLSRLGASGARHGVLAPLPDDLVDHLASIGYARTTIPAGTYPALQAGNVRTAGMPSALFTTDQLPEALTYAIVTSTLTNVGQLRAIHPSLANATFASPDPDVVPAHPGARRAAENLDRHR